MKALVVAAAMVFAGPAVAQTSPLRDLALEIPYTKTVLKNGLTLIVHEDRKAPIVAVQVWYKVGSRDEPAGRSGFAHLFEHLMFNGSEHADTDWFKPVRAMGATGINGTTNVDRTNYFQTVPKGALESILWLESDRMGHFLGAVSQAKLDEQRGVVQNEKRQGENRPYGLAYDRMVRAMYPAGHPYAHSTIGSMEDLNAAKLDDVRDWFRTWYGPSNAILVLSGDVTAAEGLAKVERAFGAIPPGPPVTRAAAWTAKRTGLQRDVMYDDVAQARIYKTWNIPEGTHRDPTLLNMAAEVLASGRTSRLHKRLVHDEQVATSVGARADIGEIAGQFDITVDLKPDADPAKIEAAADEELARFLKEGPTPAELERVRTTEASDLARRLESVFSKSSLLVQSESRYGTPDGWKQWFEITRTATREDVRAAAQRWLSDGAYVLTVLPRPAFAAASAGVRRGSMPAPAETMAAELPAFERATLANGLKLIVASRRTAPIVNLTLSVETGFGPAEARTPVGTASLTADLLDEGTVSRTGLELSDALRGLGANLNSYGDAERAAVTLSTLTPTLDAALALFADVALNPAFREEDVERLRKQAIVGVARERLEPPSAAQRALRALVFGADHPYGRLATETSLAAVTRADAAAYHKRWFAPDNATLIVVGDTTLADIRPKIEKAFGGWAGKSAVRDAVADAPKAAPGVYVVDRPGAPQSYVLAAVAAPRWNAEDELAVMLLNDAFGGSFNSRLNMNLREDKGWSYGAGSGMAIGGRGPRLYQMRAPVQTDRTADSVRELRREIAELAGPRPVTGDELAQSKNDITLALPSRWETLGAVGGGIDELVYRGLPDDYWSTFADRVRRTSAAELSAVAAKAVRPADMTWVIVGDAAKILPAFETLGLGRVTLVDADGRVMDAVSGR